MASEPPVPDAAERPPWLIRLSDDIVLLTVVGLVLPTLIYIVLGLLSLLGVPAFAP